MPVFAQTHSTKPKVNTCTSAVACIARDGAEKHAPSKTQPEIDSICSSIRVGGGV